MNNEKRHSNVEDQGVDDFEQKNQLKYVHNIVSSEIVSVTRLVIKVPSNLYNPAFNKDVGLWEQYWTKDGEKILERQINVETDNKAQLIKPFDDYLQEISN